MQRTRGKVLGVVAAVAATAGLLAACGDNDSTATSTPTLAPTTTKPAASSTPGGESPADPSTSEQPQAAAPTTTVAVERPQPVPSQFVTTPSDSPALSDRDKAFIEALKAKGITPATSDIAITAGNLVCQGKSQNAPEDQIITYVTAIAGSDPSFDESKMSVEQAGKIYYDVATSSYCQ
ncbi:DUF732 domain-containing protein [Nocardia huaxiensis]|uniref:DUF732 domain-containing protein n=1 Tax=Nocardia huaxiensis TaxID=2755382 RepID=A0A7D6ZXQ1_9NOCA|nr:DUF732 domain-containing protein [Nocardia huaxiensis]QLY31169.1 DUF732 domain-containing protein [Nocardia huaxiensis]UFS94699.1 DUF732 domain-containing protein [Nocardia huaxiensis]